MSPRLTPPAPSRIDPHGSSTTWPNTKTACWAEMRGERLRGCHHSSRPAPRHVSSGCQRTQRAGFILLTAVVSAISPTRASYYTRIQGKLTASTGWRILMAGLLTLTLLAAGATLAAGHGGGLDWLPASFVLAISVAAINAWVLLVEILR
jgi:hypothetical protein